MTRPITILVADDNVDLCCTLGQYIEEQPDLHLVDVAHDGLELLCTLEKCVPDVLVLDVVMPRLDGIGVLERLQTIDADKKPRCLVLTAFGQEHITQKASQLGADYFLLKPFDLELFGRRLREIIGPEWSKEPSIEASAQVEVTSADHPTKPITQTIQMLGIPANIKGYRYLRTAILHALDDPNLLDGITTKLYPKVAEDHGSTPSRVERAIRHAINVAFTREGPEAISEYFGYSTKSSRGKPTNSEFIALVAERVRMQFGKPR